MRRGGQRTSTRASYPLCGRLPRMAYSQTQALNLQPSIGARKRLRIAIAGGSRAPERARSWIESAASWLPAELESTLLLLTCELVNNAVRHGGAAEDQVIELELSALDAGRVRVQVSDPGVGFEPAPRNQPLDEVGGWGLVLIESMAESWGVEHEDRTRVWFELAPQDD
jgi:anti-sigma regulatory factor (Ser/Thr protein kinase)